jgi:hypothetical protein
MHGKGFSQNLLDVIPFGFSPIWLKPCGILFIGNLAKARVLLHL